jgi:hypothetical protein
VALQLSSYARRCTPTPHLMVVVPTRAHTQVKRVAKREEEENGRREWGRGEVMNQAGPTRQHWNASLVSRGATHQGAVNGLNCESTKLGGKRKALWGITSMTERKKRERGDRAEKREEEVQRPVATSSSRAAEAVAREHQERARERRR